MSFRVCLVDADATFPGEGAMPGPPVVALGASAGGIEALRQLLPLLQPQWGIAFAIVLHRKAVEEDERLEDLLCRWASIDIVKAADTMPILPSRAVVCPANVHLIVEDAHFRLSSGPLENHSRPALDVTFRSIAAACGERGGGVVLSGLLDDGAAGIAALRSAGGLTVAQEPSEAAYMGMPRSAIDAGAEAVATIAQMPTILAAFAMRERTRPATLPKSVSEPIGGLATRFTCPDCHGVLVEKYQHGLTSYRCRVGHTFNPQILHEQKSREIEVALWSAAQILEEQSDLSERAAVRARRRGNEPVAAGMVARARRYRQRADVVRSALPNVNDGIEVSDLGGEATSR